MLLLVVLAALCSLVSAQSGCTGVPPMFNVGTQSNTNDVVNNGQVQPAWDALTSTTQIGATQGLPQFYLWLSDNVLGADINYNVTFAVDPTTNAYTLSTDDPTSGHLHWSENQILTVTPTCQLDGVSSVGSIKFQFPGSEYCWVAISFSKFCKWPVIDVGSHGPDGFTAGIVQNSVAVPSFNFTASGSEAITAFYVWLDPSENTTLIPQQPYDISISPVDGNIMSMNYSVANHRIAKPLNPTDYHVSRIDIQYNCVSNAATSTTQLTITITVGWNKNIEFSWFKRCHGVINTRTGLNIGFRPFGFDIVNDGIPAPAYTDAHWPPQLIGPGIRKLSLYLTLNNVTGLSSTQPITMSYRDRSVPNSPFTVSTHPLLTTLTAGVPVVSETDYSCFLPNDGFMEVTILCPPFDNITFIYDFDCVYPPFSVMLANTSASSSNAPFVLNGKSTSNVGYIAGPGELSTTFVLSLPSNSPVITQQFRANLDVYDNTKISPTANQSVSLFSTTSTAYFTVVYNCKPDLKGNGETSVRVYIEVGWNVTVPIQWVKQCPASDSSAAWSVAGIFFFTLFIIGLTFFVVKMIYNYVVLRERGCDMVPGIAYYRRCYEWATGRKNHNYGPQENYDDKAQNLSGKGYGAATYQTDL